MYYYDIWVASQQSHGRDPLTYSFAEKLVSGQLVKIPLRQRTALGVVADITTKPKFAVKNIIETLAYKLPPQSLELINWLMSYYPAGSGVITSLFIPKNLAATSRSSSFEDIKPMGNLKVLPPLTTEQKTIVKKIAVSKSRSFLLHGETGSGKTRIYQEIAREVLAKGQNVLILTPEISLTPQLVNSFEKAFGNQVVTIHSSLTEAQRRQVWLTVLKASQPLIVIGPRSALFAPFKNLGLVVLDEAQEASYKQHQNPRYQAGRVASQLAQIHKAQFIVGTATPNVADYYVAQAKGVPILRMEQLAVKQTVSKPVIQIISARDRAHFSKDSYLSNELLRAIDKALKNQEQSLVFLNRRGTARLVTCQVCGWQALCPNCDLPLTYHGDNHLMRCHTCGYKTDALTHCPVCNSTDIVYKSVGTKSIESSLKRLFPEARIGRYDSDNLTAERFDQHFEKVAQGQVDILIGTQILAKGLDLPQLAVVGVVTADTSLSFPDYTSQERTYQLIKQIIGRVGRGHRAGQAIIQTHNPDSPVLQAAITKDWDSYYQQQIAERQKFLFPPFCHLLKLSYVRKSTAGAEAAGNQVRQLLEQQGLKLQILGPSPSFYEKSKDGYQWQLIIKAKNRQALLDCLQFVPANWTYDLDPVTLL